MIIIDNVRVILFSWTYNYDIVVLHQKVTTAIFKHHLVSTRWIITFGTSPILMTSSYDVILQMSGNSCVDYAQIVLAESVGRHLSL